MLNQLKSKKTGSELLKMLQGRKMDQFDGFWHINFTGYGFCCFLHFLRDRSKGGPLLPLQLAFLDDHTGAICQQSQLPRAQLNADFQS